MTASDQYVHAHEFLLLLAFLSLPVLLATVAVLAYGIRRLRLLRGLSPLPRLYHLGILLGVPSAALLLATPIWSFWPPVSDPMLAGFICGPTLAASLLLTPTTLFLLHRSWPTQAPPSPHESAPPPSHSAS